MPGSLLSTLDVDLADADVELDPVARARARERAERALFGVSTPTRIQRYELLDAIGGGGMGMVFRAHDPKLDRQVALKVIHPRRRHDGGSRARMEKEAQALARLDHPNVVRVHDVLIHEQDVVIVMELVEGETLDKWRDARPRSLLEIIGVFVQAGDGLAAAHELGLVHRDFKPSNAVVGPRGQVKVLDFGLARFAAGGAPPAARGSSRSVELTATGDIVGTLGYASPEQLAGSPTAASSDQFSFCVALHQAVEGVSAFDGITHAARLASIRAGTPRRAADGRLVPTWLRRLIARGLAVSPADRYASMTELLIELRRVRGWRRWRAPALAIGVIAASVAATRLAGAPAASEDPCDSAATELAGTWSWVSQAQAARSLSGVGAPDIAKVLVALNSYAEGWKRTHAGTCEAYRDGQMPLPTRERHANCLEQRRVDLSTRLGVLDELSPANAAKALEVVSSMRPATDCGKLGSDDEFVSPPRGYSAAVAHARSLLSRADAEGHAGQLDAGAATLRRARAASSWIPFPALEVEQALAEARFALAWARDELPRAETIRRARDIAWKHGMVAAAIEASARLIYVEQIEHPSLARLEQFEADISGHLARVPDNRFAVPLLFNNLGVAFHAVGQPTRAHAYYRRAAVARGTSDYALELTAIDWGLAMSAALPAAREAAMREYWQGQERALGRTHPSTLGALMSYAKETVDARDAFDRMSEAAEHYARLFPKMRAQVATSAMWRAQLAREVLDPAAVAALHRIAMNRLAEATGDDMRVQEALATGELALVQRDHDRAIRAFMTVPAADADTAWWRRLMRAQAETGLGDAELLRGARQSAAAHFQRALQELASLRAESLTGEVRRTVARAYRGLERAGGAPGRSARP